MEQELPLIILVSGKAQHGKDTTAEMLQESLRNDGFRVLVAHYGDLVKYVCKMYFNWDGIKDEYGRGLLQEIGTDCVRRDDPDYWANFVVSIVSFFADEWDIVIIPDTRFPNEISCWKDAGYTVCHLRVERREDGELYESPLTEEQKNHVSETALDTVEPDFWIKNYWSLDTLRDNLNLWIKENISYE